MSSNAKDLATLKKKLFKFWDGSAAYFEHAHDLNDELSPERLKMFSLIPKKSKVLDVACGTADNGVYLVQKHGCHYTGMDISRSALKIARQHCKSPKMKLVHGDVAKLPFKAASFDAVISTYSPEHFVEPAKIYGEMVRVLKPGGRVILIAPAFEFPFGVPPSVGAERASNPVWRLAYSLKRAWWDLTSWLSTEAQFYLIHDPSVLEEGYEEDNDLTQIISIRETRKFFLNQGLKEVYRFSLAEKEENALKKGLKTLLTWLLPQYRYAGVHLFVAFQK